MSYAAPDEFSVLEFSIGEGLIQIGSEVPTKTWQAMDVTGKDEMTPIELMGVSFATFMPGTIKDMQAEVKPNLPWAEDHFLERVSRKPLNPPPSHEWWPHARKSNAEHTQDGKFSHTYPERFWPKLAGVGEYEHRRPMKGVRFDYGDLDDIVSLMRGDPFTRQAYLPVFFPEDTGQHHGQRIPCTLGYQFMVRNGCMNIIYGIRSCDFLRHFKDDVYMAMRLALWVAQESQVTDKLGALIMNIGSMHVFKGDLPLMRKRYLRYAPENN